MQTTLVIPAKWMDEMVKVMLPALRKKRVGGRISRSEMIREVMARGLPIMRKELGTKAPDGDLTKPVAKKSD